MSNPFIPNDYQQPKGDSNYLRLEDGENHIRIVSKPLMGWEGWVSDDGSRKPMRVPMDKKEECQTEDNIKHFWAVGVYNYEAQTIQVWSFTQATIIKALTGLAKNEKWGDPREYDITVVKSGEKMSTEYSVMPNPKEAPSTELVEKFKEKPFDLSKLWTNDDPFEDVDPPASNPTKPGKPKDSPPPPTEEPPPADDDGESANPLFD